MDKVYTFQAALSQCKVNNKAFMSDFGDIMINPYGGRCNAFLHPHAVNVMIGGEWREVPKKKAWRLMFGNTKNYVE